MQKSLIFLIFIFILVFSVTCYAADDENYKSATEYDYPPFSVTENGEADGFSVELLKAVAEAMDLNISFEIDEWSVIKDELKKGKLDVLPLVGYTEERDEYFDFTTPYIIMHGNIFIRTDNGEISTEEDLYGKEIIVMNGDNAHEYAQRMGFSDDLILTDTYQEAFELLAAGKHDAVLAQSLVGEELIKKLGLQNIKAATKVNEEDLKEIRTNLEGFEQKFCFAVKEGDKELLAKLNEGLAIVSAEGEFDRLYKKWFPFLINNKPDPIEVLKTSLLIVAPILLIILIIAAIFIRYRIKLNKKKLFESNKAILNMEAHLRSQQKLEAIGVLASGVAHEINNPINGIINYGQILLDIAQNEKAVCKEYGEEVKSYSNEIINESNRISSIVSNLLQLSRNGNKQFVRCNIRKTIDGLLSLVSTIIKKDQIHIKINIDNDVPEIECREQEIQQVLLNLIINAKDALNAKFDKNKDNKIINIDVINIKQINKESGIRISVKDNGNGIPVDVQKNIFDPFFTTKNRSEGTGLGLSISYGIINEHNGKLSFETKKGQYTVFNIDLPIKQS